MGMGGSQAMGGSQRGIVQDMRDEVGKEKDKEQRRAEEDLLPGELPDTGEGGDE